MKVTLKRGAACTTVDGGANESILDSLLRSRADVSYCCRGGICGLCASTLLEGEVAEVGPPVAFSAAPRLKAGEVLICRCRPTTDCVVRQSVASWAGTAGEPRILAVSHNETLDDRIVHVRLASGADGDAMRFRAGQSVRLERSDGTPIPPGRFYIASRPGLAHLDFYLPADRDRESLAALVPGAAVRVGEPIGSASLREDETEPIVVVAERAGLASALGILDALFTYQVSRPACLVMKGAARGVVERMLGELTDRACLPLTVLDGAQGGLRNAVEEALVELHGSTHVPVSRFRAYVKATRASIVEARSALHGGGMRPWNVHVEELEP
jgi:ferredoxin/NAD(P)H-flavin reductase